MRVTQAMGRVGAHPNLVNIYDLDEEAGVLFIVQEYISGGSLAGLVGEEPPRWVTSRRAGRRPR